MSSAAEKAVEALELLPEEMREPAAAYLLSQAKKFRALKDAVDEGMADVEAGRVVRVVVSLRARSDILSSHSYLAERSLVAADRMLVRFSQRFDELREFPFLGPDRSELHTSLRGLLMDGYIAFYTVEADRIVIVRVVDSRMDIEREI